jgi:hypothetical protein
MKNPSRMARREFVIGIVVGIVAIIYLINTRFIPTNDVVSVGAEFVPAIYGTFLLLLAVLQMINGIWLWRRESSSGKKNDAAEKSSLANVFVIIAIIVCYCFILRYIGFVIASIGLLYAMCTVLTPGYAKKRPVVCGLFSVALPLVTYVLFNNILHLLLPRGILFG